MQVDLPVDQRLPAAGGPGGHHSDLAREGPAERAGVLPGHPDRGPALLGEAGLVDHQHSRSAGPGAPPAVVQAVDDVTAGENPQLINVPARAVQQMPLPPRLGVSAVLGQLSAVLA
ncbi:hypothetical protein V1460_16670 [Streptomyces sp. SCSIO 30461]